MALNVKKLVNEDTLREEAIKALGLEGVDPKVQEEIIVTVRDTLLEYINIAVMNALGAEGMMKLADIEETPEAFDKKLAELLPNIGEIVKGAIEEGLEKHRTLVDDVRRRFGASPADLLQGNTATA
jgi:hypothetical protein